MEETLKENIKIFMSECIEFGTTKIDCQSENVPLNTAFYALEIFHI